MSEIKDKTNKLKQHNKNIISNNVSKKSINNLSNISNITNITKNLDKSSIIEEDISYLNNKDNKIINRVKIEENRSNIAKINYDDVSNRKTNKNVNDNYDCISKFEDLKRNLTLLNYQTPNSKINLDINTLNSPSPQLMFSIVHFLITSIDFDFRNKFIDKIVDEDLKKNPNIDEVNLITCSDDIKKILTFFYPATTLLECKKFKEVVLSILYKLKELEIVEKSFFIGSSILDKSNISVLITFLFELSCTVLRTKVDYCLHENNIKEMNFILGTDETTNILESNIEVLKNEILETIQSMSWNYDKTKDYVDLMYKENEKLSKTKITLQSKIKQFSKLNLDENDVFSINRMVQLEYYELFFKNIDEINKQIENKHKDDSISDNNENSSYYLSNKNKLYEIDSDKRLKNSENAVLTLENIVKAKENFDNGDYHNDNDKIKDNTNNIIFLNKLVEDSNKLLRQDLTSMDITKFKSTEEKLINLNTKIKELKDNLISV